MAKPLVIVESPTKARTIARFLGDGYVVESSVGHIRDLPRSAKEIPATVKSQSWARLGVNVTDGFKPLYIIPAEKREQVKKLKGLLKDASELYLATDEDREGESIAWHLLEVLAPKIPIHRMVFHEITETAIRQALVNSRQLDTRLVDAQEARRILDRLYGYEVSPVLWKKVLPRLSAGRVQSVACRLLVARERERMAFRSSDYADLVATVATQEQASFTARLVAVGGLRVAQSRDFDPLGGLGTSARSEGVLQLTQAEAGALGEALEGASFAVVQVEERPLKRSPAPPFMTSTLQQEAGRKLRFSSSRTMSVAQRLYERGFITYMRTDSVTLAREAIAEARRVVVERFGAGSVPSSPRAYRSKVKNAQEAHEAIRPSGESWRAPDQLKGQLVGDELRLYDLIWKRTLASQMRDALGVTVSVRVEGATQRAVAIADAMVAEGTLNAFNASVRVFKELGFLRAYGVDDDDDDGAQLPSVSIGDLLSLEGIEVESHTTQPPARYSEATLVKTLEERGIGRPSTYASIISTIIDRGYTWKKGQALVPTFVAFAVVQLLEQHFASLVNYDFTAQLEDDLDRIAEGVTEAVPYLEEFYFGTADNGLHQLVERELAEIDARSVNTIAIATSPDGEPIVARVGRYGPYLQLGELTAAIPDSVAPDELDGELALELLHKAQVKDRVLPQEDGDPILVRTGRFGGYVQRGEGDDKTLKRASLLPSQSVETITELEAIALLSLPRVVGVDPETSQELLAHNGRFGPYLSKGRETRSLETPEQIFSIDIADALRRFKEPKRRGTKRASSMEVGVDPETKASIVLRSGRFGPYLSDGTINASLPRGMEPSEVTLESALDLLAERRAKVANDRESS
ncbi:MAG: type I DNA topoisomerase [Ferrimicrobium sp.]